MHIFLFLITFVNSQPDDLFSNGIFRGSSSRNTLNQCVKMDKGSRCGTMPWNMTIYPNLLGHTGPDGKNLIVKSITTKRTK